MFSQLRSDIQAIFERDPAARSTLEVIFAYPGLHALWFHRLAHRLWLGKMRFLGRLVSHVGRLLTGIEIHPGATIGPGFFIDHGMGVVIGETAEVGANVTLYHGVTLGGVSWRKEKRHPTVGDHVVIGEHSRIGANSVVVKDVPPHSVVVGVPGRARSRYGDLVEDKAHEDLSHDRLHDTTMDLLQQVATRVSALEREVARYNGHLDEQGQVEAEGYDGPWGI